MGSMLERIMFVAIVLLVVVIIAMWSQWPERDTWGIDFVPKIMTEYAERCGTLLVMSETLLETANDSINRLRLLVESDDNVDTAVSNLVWARDYVIARLLDLGETVNVDVTYPYPKPEAAPLRDE
jgi:hypothetical protein